MVSEHSAAWKYTLKPSNALSVMLAIVLLDSQFLLRVLLLLQQPVLVVEDLSDLQLKKILGLSALQKEKAVVV